MKGRAPVVTNSLEVFMKGLLVVFAFLVVSASVQAKAIGHSVDYRDGDLSFQGYIAFDEAFSARRPGVLVVHDWMGVSAETRRRCEMLAELGYVAFAADVYGKGVRPSSPEEAGKLAGLYKGDRALYRKRLALALAQLKKDVHVDASKLAAIGYCFGGTGVIELARSGADVKGVVSFHGGLDSPRPEDGKAIRCKVLALHGADDPNVPADQVAAFQDEMRKAGVDWQMVYYGGAVHAFTNPGAGSDPHRGAAYDARADARSWDAMREFFQELFK
jgi:dienelactone hydrolase